MYSFFSRNVMLCISLTFFVVSFHAKAQFSSADRPQLVAVEPLSFEYESTLIEAVGSAQARRSVTLFASVSDEVTGVNFIPGQLVSRGDVLVTLDSRLQDVAMERAEIQLEDAQRNLKRIQASLNKGAVTEVELDDAKTAVRLAKVNVDEAKVNREDRNIRAPFNGVVGFTEIEVGDRISPQTEITTIDDRSTLFVNFVAPELAVSYLLEKPDVQLQPWTDRTVSLNAAIGELDSRVNLQDRTIRVRALLDNASDQYRPGMSFRVTLAVRGERYVAIPEAALSWGASGAYVWLAEDNTAKRVDVQVKQRLRGRILVSGYLRDGETLVVEGVQSLRQGQALSFEDTGARMTKKTSNQEVTS
jgi:RND family efflux transporter MFP subunit